ncbi:hypothetical protein ACLMJK_006122 [Lecanora helva]
MAEDNDLTRRIQEWYGQLASRRVDLVGDYAGREVFLLEGDSLLLQCFSDPKLDFDYSKRPKYLLARSVVLRHLKINLARKHPSVHVETFTSIQDSNFHEYLHGTGVYFVMCHDGASPNQASDTMGARQNEESAVSKNRETLRKARFRSMILRLIIRGYNIALINGLDFIDTKVMTMVVEISRKAPTTHVFREELKSEDPPVFESPLDSNEDTALERLLSKMNLRQDQQSRAEKGFICDCSAANPSKAILTEREIATVIVLGRMLQEQEVSESAVAKILLHTVLLGSLPLSHRRKATAGDNAISQLSTNIDLPRLSTLFTALLSGNIWAEVMRCCNVQCDICDLVDGRLLKALLSQPNLPTVNSHAAKRFEALAHAMCAAYGMHLERPPWSGNKVSEYAEMNGTINDDMTILPFANPIFDKHLLSISLSLPPSKQSSGLSGRIHQEVSHWHNAKRPLDLKQNQRNPVSDKEKLRSLRRNQFFMAEMQAYAASLTNAVGKVLEPETITVSASDNSGNKDQKKIVENKSKGKAIPNRKGGGKKQMFEDIAAQKAAKDSEIDEKAFSSWRIVRNNLESERQLPSKYFKIKAYLRDLPESKKIVSAEVQLHLLCVLFDIYRLLCKDPSERRPSRIEVLGVAALMWDTSRQIANASGLSKSIVGRTRLIVNALGLPDPAITMPVADRKLSFESQIVLNDDDSLKIGLDLTHFQLEYCGPYFDRNLDSAPDPRVPFHPDRWQRDVLDELDAEHSIFVVAPTSAGKTFISFYAMEKVLRADDDSVLVYVAPTKALVNQIAAEIQARFKKTYKHAGKSTWAIHTRDYRINNPSGCQILVTVPHILQIMLLAPSNAKAWSPRVKYIIFDEIHSIAQAEDGVVWEQLLLLAPCSIIALSATVGNPEVFHGWLNSTQQSFGHQVKMIRHQTRYSELRKFVFVPPKRFAFRGLADRPSFGTLGLDGLAGLSFVHPITSLVNKSRGMPDDLSLESRDCLTLLRAMQRHANAEYPVSPDLEPSQRGFPNVIRKAEIIDWERDLKVLLKHWMANNDSPFDEVLHDLNSSMGQAIQADAEVSKGSLSDKTDDLVRIESDNLYSTTLPLLCKLHERNALPAIFFNYDRHKCENIAKSLITQLDNAETLWKENNTLWKNKIVAFEQWKQDKEKLGSKRSAKILPKKKGKSDFDDDSASGMDKLQDAASEEASPFTNFDPDAPVDGFHFAAKHLADAEDLSRYFWQMKKRGVSSWLMVALQRGIGVHHAGMNRKYRQIVEILFRRGYLRVVIATGTLALGINMPCATVVFSGDSIFLTALNFRQAAGRAGRRGFDLLGNVVFQGISHSKVCRLLSSRLPDLNGHFPVTTSLVLRLCTLLHESGNSTYAVQAINSLLSQPRFYLDGPSFQSQTLHHLRFSIEYLRRQDLLSSNGAPINFAGLTSHLYFTENSNFALNALIKGGYFHGLCSEIGNKESHVLRTLMVVMAHLFGRRPCREADAEYIENTVKRSPSVVFLPPLPASAARVLPQHNEDTLQVFTTYVRTFVDQHIHTQDNTMPLTSVEVGGSDNDLVLPGMMPPTKIRSAFVALSGADDTFESISDLCRSSRSGVFLEEAVIPHLDMYPDESKTPLNAYLYDFYMHGDIEALEKANGVRKADVWFLLNDFSLVLATIVASLANFLKLPESDLSLLDVIGEGDETNNAEDDKFVADSTTEDTESVSASIATNDTGKTSVTSATSVNSSKSKQAASKKKEKVADSWEDSEDSEDELRESEAHKGEEREDRSKEELERGFLNVYTAIMKLRAEFDTKFRKIFA